MIPLFHPPKMNVEKILLEIQNTLYSRWIGQAYKVDLFEKKFSEKFNLSNCLMTNSGTSALHLAYICAGIQSGDEVIVPVLTCTATNHPLLWMGAKPIFADIRSDTLTIDPEDVERKITEKTKAIVQVHLGGSVFDRNEIKSICYEYKLKLIEDACQALGNPSVGYGDFTCFSFQAIKTMTTGDGGLLVCKSKEDYQRAKKLRWFSIDRDQKAEKNWQAWDRRGITFDQEEMGYKYQPTDIDACIGLIGLETIDSSLKHRKILSDLYKNLLRDNQKVKLLTVDPRSANWLFMILIKDRDTIAEKLHSAGIETNVAHIRNDIFKVFGGERLDLSNMNSVEFNYLCLPINDYVSIEDVKYICEKLND